MRMTTVGSGVLSGMRLALLCSTASVLAVPALAQDATEAPSEERQSSASNDSDIVVTALRRSTSIQETPLAISAVGAQTLNNQGITSSQGLARVAPNLVIRENANGGSRVIIRNIQSAGEPTVGLYYDETPITGSSGVSNDAGGSTPEVRLFDIERVEVLRGPQGTLYGAGSMAGTVRLIFNKPNLSQFEGEVAGQVTSVAHGDFGYNAQGAVNVPIVDGVLGVRAVGFYERAGGWLENSTLGFKNFNDSKSYGGRVLVRYEPMENLTIDGLAVYQNRKGFSSQWDYQQYADTGVAYDQTVDTATPQRDRMQLYSGTANWDLDFATLTAVAAYSKRELEFSFNFTPFFQRAAVKLPTAAGCLNYFGIPRVTGASCNAAQTATYGGYVDAMLPAATFQPQSTKTSSQEVRLANGKDRLKWTLGFYHSKRDNTVNSIVGTANPVTGRLDEGFQNNFDRSVDDTLEQFAGFAELTFEVTDALSVTGGLRYFDYSKETTSQVLVGNFVVGNQPSPATSNKVSENGTILNFNVNYKVTSDVMIYASATQGFRPGGVNQIVGLSDELAAYATSYQSDSLWNYELGFKTSWFDRVLTLNGSLFQIDWDNIQVSASANNGAFGFVTNAGTVRVRGAELEATVRPVEGLTLRGSGSYTSAKLQGDQVGPPGIVIQGAGRDGDYVPYTPKYTAQASAEYVFPVTDTLDILTHADVSYLGSSWTQFDRSGPSAIPYLRRLPGMAVAGLRAGVQSNDGGWGIFAYATNLFDKVGIINKNSGASIGGDDPRGLQVVGIAPRTIGLNFRKKF